jgi:hypothetical protein
MSVNLNEFEPRLLKMAKEMFEGKIKTLNLSLQQIECWQPSEVKDDLYREIFQEFDDAILWKIQLENALNELKVLQN